MFSKIKELKERETKLDELEIKILRKRYINEIRNTNRTKNRITNQKKTKK